MLSAESLRELFGTERHRSFIIQALAIKNWKIGPMAVVRCHDDMKDERMDANSESVWSASDIEMSCDEQVYWWNPITAMHVPIRSNPGTLHWDMGTLERIKSGANKNNKRDFTCSSKTFCPRVDLRVSELTGPVVGSRKSPEAEEEKAWNSSPCHQNNVNEWWRWRTECDEYCCTTDGDRNMIANLWPISSTKNVVEMPISVLPSPT
jgi:hypothetical protein